MDRVADFGFERSAFINGISDDVHDSAEGFGADGDGDGATQVGDGLSTHKAFGGVHGNGADSAVSQVLSDLEDELVRSALDLQSVEDGRERSVKLHVDNGSDNLGDRSVNVGGLGGGRLSWFLGRSLSGRWLLRRLSLGGRKGGSNLPA